MKAWPSTSVRLVDPLLLVDAGNTRTKVGLFDRSEIHSSELPVCRFVLAVPGDEGFPWNELSAEIGDSMPRLVACLTGSHPPRVAKLESEWPADWPAPRPLVDRSEFPITIDVDFPERVGIDRLLNGVAANELRSDRCAAIVIDSGTTTTIDYLDAESRFQGGVILPGFDLSARALNAYTALLPLVEKGSLIQSPPPEIGRNTEEAIQAGLYWGHVGSVREILSRFLQRSSVGHGAAESGLSEAHGATDRTLVILTGGGGPLLLPHFADVAHFEPNLTLQGLALIAASSLAAKSDA